MASGRPGALDKFLAGARRGPNGCLVHGDCVLSIVDCRSSICLSPAACCSLVLGMRRTLLIVTRAGRLRAALRALCGPGLRVLEARTGLSALLLCACRPVDLAVLDTEAPGMDPPTLLAKLSGAFPALPILTVTSRDGAATLAERIREALDAAAPRKQPAVESAIGAGSAERRPA